ncbi:MAG: hypothetical protein HC788_01865 [Sphingopyxis sp.]|nr:hypothetical protein [Sphingopyxis sp.]
MASDNFLSFGDVPSAPAQHIFVITPAAAPLARITKAIRVGSDGTVTIRAIGDTSDIVHPVMAGELIIARLSHVVAANPAMTIVGYA